MERFGDRNSQKGEHVRVGQHGQPGEESRCRYAVAIGPDQIVSIETKLLDRCGAPCGEGRSRREGLRHAAIASVCGVCGSAATRQCVPPPIRCEPACNFDPCFGVIGAQL
jgi:hypothetical protein